jgi:hypothetical protein
MRPDIRPGGVFPDYSLPITALLDYSEQSALGRNHAIAGLTF